MDFERQNTWEEFAVAEVLAKKCSSAHEHSDVLDDFEQTYLQISSGEYRGFSGKIQLDDGIAILLESYNQRLDQWGALSRQSYCLLFLVDGRGRSCLGSQDLNLEDVIIIPPGSDYDLISYPFANYCALSITRSILDPYIASIDPEILLYDHSPAPSVILRKPDVLPILRDVARQIIRTVNAAGTVAIRPGHLRTQKSALVTVAAGIMSEWLGTYHTGEPWRPDHRGIALAARNILRKTSHLNYSVELFARSLGVSRRTLEIHFRKQFGQSPSQYKRIIQLNNFQKSLSQAGCQEKTIGDIAAECGFWHLSRLAQQYKSHFGELPSQSLEKMR